MEEKINIAEILKDKKNGLRLYSPIFGECIFCYVRKDANYICVKKHNGVKELFDSKFTQLLKETKQRLQKEFDEL